MLENHGRKVAVIRVLSFVAVAFGLLTIKEGGAVLFFDGSERAAAGNYVPFVLWFNFLAGFAYVAAGVGLWLRRHWGMRLAMVIAGATALMFAAFGIHIVLGGAFESRTVGAMIMRTLVWIAIAGISYRCLAHRLPICRFH